MTTKTKPRDEQIAELDAEILRLNDAWKPLANVQAANFMTGAGSTEAYVRKQELGLAIDTAQITRSHLCLDAARDRLAAEVAQQEEARDSGGEAIAAAYAARLAAEQALRDATLHECKVRNRASERRARLRELQREVGDRETELHQWNAEKRRDAALLEEGLRSLGRPGHALN